MQIEPYRQTPIVVARDRSLAPTAGALAAGAVALGALAAGAITLGRALWREKPREVPASAAPEPPTAVTEPVITMRSRRMRIVLEEEITLIDER